MTSKFKVGDCVTLIHSGEVRMIQHVTKVTKTQVIISNYPAKFNMLGRIKGSDKYDGRRIVLATEKHVEMVRRRYLLTCLADVDFRSFTTASLEIISAAVKEERNR
jgi:hypothetical protein